MCGLFGVSTNRLVTHEVDLFRGLGIVSQFRGIDSTGVAIASRAKKRKDFNYNVLKAQQDPSYFFMQNSVDQFITQFGVSAIIGHCRAATVGNVTAENAHPYDVGDIIGAHNGTIRGLEPAADSGGITTDSYALYQIIAREGLEAGLKRAQSGAFALTYFNKQDDTVNLIRNKERELWLAQIGNAFYWASEEDFIRFIAGRMKKEITSIKLLPEYVLYTIKCGTMNLTKRTITLPEPEAVVRTFPPRNFGGRINDELPFLRNGTNTNTPTHPLQATSNGTADGSELVRVKIDNANSTTIESAKSVFATRPASGYPKRILVSNDKLPNPLVKLLRYRTFDGMFVSEDEIIPKLLGGCVVSGEIADPTTTVYWISPDNYVLPDFRNNQMVEEMCKVYGVKPVPGLLYYAHPGTIRRINDKIKTTQARNNQPTCH